MAYAGAPRDVWNLNRLEEWHQVLGAVRSSSDWNAPHAAGKLRPGVQLSAIRAFLHKQ
jgi:hypothetical protein